MYHKKIVKRRSQRNCTVLAPAADGRLRRQACFIVVPQILHLCQTRSGRRCGLFRALLRALLRASSHFDSQHFAEGSDSVQALLAFRACLKLIESRVDRGGLVNGDSIPVSDLCISPGKASITNMHNRKTVFRSDDRTCSSISELETY